MKEENKEGKDLVSKGRKVKEEKKEGKDLVSEGGIKGRKQFGE